jgi:hypothetical protein
MATNRQDTLDPALLRPGRLDRKIEFPLPSRREKRLIFQTVTATMNLAPDVDLEDCASLCIPIFLPRPTADNIRFFCRIFRRIETGQAFVCRYRFDLPGCRSTRSASTFPSIPPRFPCIYSRSISTLHRLTLLPRLSPFLSSRSKEPIRHSPARLRRGLQEQRQEVGRRPRVLCVASFRFPSLPASIHWTLTFRLVSLLVHHTDR